jgi:cytidine deaminase
MDGTVSDPSPPAAADDLVAAAHSARERSYAPYSGFAMGAAVRTADGSVVPGSLVESISLGLAMCAERVAIFSAVAAGAAPITALALVARRTAGEVTMPCGACLQVLAEHAGGDCAVIGEAPDGERRTERLADLAPSLPLRRT